MTDDSAHQSHGPVVVNYSSLIGPTRVWSAESAKQENHNPDFVLSPEDEALLGGVLRELQLAEGSPGVLTAPDSQDACILQSFLAEHADVRRKFAEGLEGTREARFDNHDWHWIKLAIAEIRRRRGIAHRDPWPGVPRVSEVAEIAGEIRAAVLGDWGTGMYGALPIGQSIVDAADYHALVHLGDIYYSGTHKEIEEQFLPSWQQMMDANPGSVSRACNGNHEMYSGGGAYFSRVMGALNQRTSMFAVRNAEWLLVGLDTAYDDSDLGRAQLRWLRQVVAANGDRKLVLFSHHQPFSALSGQGTKVVEALETALNLDRIFAWYWGHEHLWAAYDRNDDWPFYGRCNGHAGFPYFRPKELARRNLRAQDLSIGNLVLKEVPGRGPSGEHQPRSVPRAWILDGSNDKLGDERAHYGPNGFMRLLFTSDGTIHEQLLHYDGRLLWENELR